MLEWQVNSGWGMCFVSQQSTAALTQDRAASSAFFYQHSISVVMCVVFEV